MLCWIDHELFGATSALTGSGSIHHMFDHSSRAGGSCHDGPSDLQQPAHTWEPLVVLLSPVETVVWPG